MVNKIVSGWDPGGTTGFCIAVLDPDVPAGFRVLESGIIPWANRFSRIRHLLDRYRPHTSVVESFTLYRHKAQDQIGSTFPSSQIIGVIEAYCFMSGLAMPVYQSASLISGRPPVKVLPEHVSQLYQDTAVMMEHSKDAYKHIRYWVEANRRQFVRERPQ